MAVWWSETGVYSQWISRRSLRRRRNTNAPWRRRSRLRNRPVARVLFHIPLLEVGGSEVGLFELATRLPRDAFQPLIWCSERDGTIGAALREAGIPVYQRALQVDEAAASWVRELRPSIFHSLS